MNAWLIDTALYTGLLIGAVLILRRPVGRMFGPGMAYALWALPLLRFVLPPIVLPSSMAPVQPVVEPALLSAAYAPPADGIIPMVMPVDPVWQWTDMALPLWLAGAALLLAWRISTYRRMRREVLRGAKPVGEVGKVRLVETPAVDSPVAFGVRDKVVALPVRFMAMEDRAARDLAIAHELAHHQGRDILANFAAQPLLAMHWFNPLAWAGWRAMRRDQEAACDARVMAGRDAGERVAYARLIAGFAAGPRLSLAAPMACPMVGEKSIIHRLRSLSMTDVSTRRRWLGRALFGGAAIALPLTASISYAADVPAPVETVQVAPSVAPSAPDIPAAPVARKVRVIKHDADAEAGPDATVIREKRVFRIRRTDDEDGDTRVFEWSSDQPLNDEQRKKLDAMMARIKERDFAAMARRDELLALRAEKFATHQEEFAKRSEEAAARFADIEMHVPLVEMNCDKAGDEGKREWTDDAGRKHIVICRQRIVGRAAMGLRAARNAIAVNRDLTREVRDDVLKELDAEIERIEKQQG